MIEWNGKEVRVSGKMEKSETTDENKVYINDYVTVNVNDDSIAKKNNRVYITYTSDYKVWFDGDTYNQKDEIQKLAKKYKVKANYTGKHWEIDTEDIIEDEDLVSFLKEILEKYDYSFLTAKKIKRDIKEFA